MTAPQSLRHDSRSDDRDASNGLTAGRLHRAEMLDKGRAHMPGGMERMSVTHHHDTHYSTKFKTAYFWNFPLMCLDYSRLQVPETTKSETVDKGDDCVLFPKAGLHTGSSYLRLSKLSSLRRMSSCPVIFIFNKQKFQGHPASSPNFLKPFTGSL